MYVCARACACMCVSVCACVCVCCDTRCTSSIKLTIHAVTEMARCSGMSPSLLVPFEVMVPDVDIERKEVCTPWNYYLSPVIDGPVRRAQRSGVKGQSTTLYRSCHKHIMQS